MRSVSSLDTAREGMSLRGARWLAGLAVFWAALSAGTPSAHAAIVLDGHSLDCREVQRVADGEAVRVDPAALVRVAQGNEVLLAAAAHGQRIYGLTVGVGENKDRVFVNNSKGLSPQLVAASLRFNIALLRAHSSGVGPDLPVRIARAALVVRLNTLLDGAAGVQPRIVEDYAALLNDGITPAMPGSGSVGEADITVMANVGRALLGEGYVYVRGHRVPAGPALRAAGIEPIRPYGKDALGILGSNALSAARAALALADLRRLIRAQELVYALSLQALNGNVSPLRQDTLALRPFPATVRAGTELRSLLAGASIWRPDPKRPLQDPLSFRDGVYLIGELQRTYAEVHRLLLIQINHSDDNPGVMIGQGRRQLSGDVHVGGIAGAVLLSANFDPLPWVLSLEEASIALGHASLASLERVVHLGDPYLTGLTRFLGTAHTIHAFGAVEKDVAALAEDNVALAQPVSLDFLPLAGGIEDMATNAPRVAMRLQRQIDNSFAMLGIELVEAAQAVDLRRNVDPQFRLSAPTEALYVALRRQVRFLDRDRSMTADFRRAGSLLRGLDDGAPTALATTTNTLPRAPARRAGSPSPGCRSGSASPHGRPAEARP